MGEVGLLMRKCGAPGRRARFEGISGLAALALEMPQDSINHASISNNGDNLHLRATGTQHRVYFKNLGKQARPCAASIFGELRVLVGPGGLCCGTGEILRHSGGYSRPVAVGSIRKNLLRPGVIASRSRPAAATFGGVPLLSSQPLQQIRVLQGAVGPPAPTCVLFAFRSERGRVLSQSYRSTRAVPPFITFSTSFWFTVVVSPGVVMARAPCAAP